MILALGLAGWVGWSVRKDEKLGEGIAAFFTVWIIASGAVALLILAIGSVSIESSDHQKIETKSYTIAEGSTFSTDGYVKFVEKTSEGDLIPQKIDAAKVEYKTKNIKQVQVDTFEIRQTALVPWTWGIDKHAIIK